MEEVISSQLSVVSSQLHWVIRGEDRLWSGSPRAAEGARAVPQLDDVQLKTDN
jgi:hypothetical protein